MKTVPRTCAFLLLFLCSPIVKAQGPDAAAPSPHREKIRHLLELTGAAQIGAQVADQVFALLKKTMTEVPEEFWPIVRSKVTPAGMIAELMPVYEKHLTEADVDAAIAFFSSPAGKQFLAKQPLILADTQKVGAAWGERIAREALAELKKKGYGAP